MMNPENQKITLSSLADWAELGKNLILADTQRLAVTPNKLAKMISFDKRDLYAAIKKKRFTHALLLRYCEAMGHTVTITIQ